MRLHNIKIEYVYGRFPQMWNEKKTLLYMPKF